MSSRVLVAEPPIARAVAKPVEKPKPALEYFSTKESSAGDSSAMAYNLAGLKIFAPGAGGESKPTARPARVLLPSSIQAKLEVGAVDDPLEHDADRVAERVMRMSDPADAMPLPLTTSVSHLQRKCSCGGSGEECEACKEKREKERLQRKPRTNGPTGGVPALVHEVLRSPGQPLDEGIQSFFAPRFAYDFSRVRVHTDERAAESAHSMHALAYTVGNRIVFGNGQYAPRTESGRRLIAHELAHTVQQGAGSPTSLRRAVTKDYDKLHDWLTRGFFDWAVTDSDAHKSLMVLKALNPADLRDTVAAMEKDGLVDTLFSNVSDDDSQKETDLLERINDVRVHKGGKAQPGLVGPCDAKQRKQIDDRVSGTKDWAREAKNRANAFAADPAKHADTGKLLDTHFFHQKNNGALAQADQVNDALKIAANFQTAEVQQNPMPNLCASPFDPLCASFLAYVSRTKNRVVFCSSYFDAKPQRQIYFLLHELMHEFARVDDRGYGDERVFAYLTPAEAMNNADAYALFAVDVNDKEETSSDIRPVPHNKVSDCGGNEPEVQRRFAFAARMITNALNIISDPTIGGTEAQTHFKTQDRVKLQQVIDRFRKINDQFAGGMNFECENKCDNDWTGYRRRGGWTVHLCPAWFKLPSADARTDNILLIAIAEELGMDYGPPVGTSDYANLSEKKAYDSASAYVGYARDVTKNFFR
jgi:Domain of unknown function (DUF4157)/Lysine-specific metallo-endopeptidase